MSCTVEPTIQSSDTVQQICLVDSCQLTITWMSIIKFNTESICPGHLAEDLGQQRPQPGCGVQQF